MLERLLQVCAEENPAIDFPKCGTYKYLKFPTKRLAAAIKFTTLWILRQLFPSEELRSCFLKEKRQKNTFGTSSDVFVYFLFLRHVEVNQFESLCPNWAELSSLTIDTKGYPQLCYSNLALMPKVKINDISLTMIRSELLMELIYTLLLVGQKF